MLNRHLVAISLVAIAFTGLASCGKSKSSKKGGDPAGVALPNPLDNNSVLVIGKKMLVSTTSDKATGTSDPGLAEFTSDLYPLIRANCSAGGCHESNQYPFGSQGIPLAFTTAKAYIKANLDESQMIINIRTGHNGVDAGLEAQFGPAITKVAAAINK